MPTNIGSMGASAPPTEGAQGATGGGGGGGGILGFFSNFFTYGKEQDIIRTGGDLQKFFQPGKYTPDRDYNMFIIGFLVLLLGVLLFLSRK